MNPTMEVDIQLIYNISNTLALIADGLMDGHLTPTVGDDAKALEVKKNLINRSTLTSTALRLLLIL
jgi:hypothetical protein